MDPRTRVKTALAHETPDRVPLALWGGPYGLVDPLYFQLVEKLNLGEPVAPIREGHTVNHIDDRLLDALGTDTRLIWPGASPTRPPHPRAAD
jgi:hypothetical protein